MREINGFREMIQQIRDGNSEIAAAMIKEYESELRIIARVRLRDPRLRRTVDSMDICQSILANFFVRATMGQFEIDTPEQLMKLLGAMVRNKVVDYARRQSTERRDMARTAATPVDDLPLISQGDTPSQVVMARELIQLARSGFTDDEWNIVERRREGRTWDEIASVVGGAPDALRKKMSRAIERVAGQLRLDSFADLN